MLKPEVSIPVALATGAVVVGIFQAMQPTQADQKTVTPGSMGSDFLAGSEKSAFYTSLAVVGGVSLVAKDPVPFWVGGMIACALAWTSRYAREMDPSTGKLGAGASVTSGRRTASVNLVAVAG
jgi:hypothetical protein